MKGFDMLTLLATNLCKNDCAICCDNGESVLSMQHLNHEGINTLLKAFSADQLNITGGDPLRNLWLLEQSLEHHIGEKSILINPLSFLINGQNIRGRYLTTKDATKSIEKMRQDGINQKNKKIVDLLYYYKVIGLSNGLMQAPNPKLAKLAGQYFKEGIMPNLRSKIRYSNIDNPLDVSCIGSFFDKGMDKRERQYKTFSCKSPSYVVSFSNDELRLHICSSDGTSDKVSSYYTGITLDDLSCMKPNEARREIKRAAKYYKKTGLYKLLSPANISPFAYKKTQNRFELFFKWSNDFLRMHNKEPVEYIKTMRPKATPCEVCSSIALSLKRYNIDAKEYQNYIDDRFNTEIKSS